MVTRVEAYGLFVDHAGSPILVLAPDASTVRPLDLAATFSVGDRLTVRILRFVPETSIYKGSIVADAETERQGRR